MSHVTTRPAAGGYSPTAKALHWVVAVLVIGLIAVGIGREFMPKGPTKDLVTGLHKATGIVVMVLMFVRIRHRLANPPPPPEPGLPGWQVGLSHLTHWLMYAILLIMPMIGWLGSNALGKPVSMYRLFDLPTLTAEDKPFGEALYTAHGVLGYFLLALVVLHVGAALYHHYGRKDATLMRMTSEPAR